VISNPVGKFGTYQRAGALIVVTLVTVVYGCGSSTDTESVVKSANSVKLDPEELYRYEGEGANKTKVSLDRREKRKARFDKAKELQGK